MSWAASSTAEGCCQSRGNQPVIAAQSIYAGARRGASMSIARPVLGAWEVCPMVMAIFGALLPRFVILVGWVNDPAAMGQRR